MSRHPATQRCDRHVVLVALAAGDSLHQVTSEKADYQNEFHNLSDSHNTLNSSPATDGTVTSLEDARHAELTTGYDGQWTEVTGSASVSGSISGSMTGPVTTKTRYDHHHRTSEATFEEHYESDSESESHSDVPDHYYWSHSDYSEERDRTARTRPVPTLSPIGW